MKYAKGSYNKFDDVEQWLRLSEGCPNNCKFCYETKENGTKPIYYEVPKIVRNKVKIMDMNLIYKPLAKEYIDYLGMQRVNKKVVYYELICGIDYRFMSQDIANSLKASRFKNIRLAWDHNIQEQKKIRQCVKYLLKAGYNSKEISIFMVCDWKISYKDNLFKMDLCKIWNVKINDCWYDNTKSPEFQLNYWTLDQCKDFRKKCRKHNQMVLFGIDPELK